ncbi:MAG: UDP-N-acetylmuramate--L-alanine ligase [Suipraeoptans sp.]
MYKIDFNEPIHIHFIGIGGISMSGLAEILAKEGFTITGSDNQNSPLIEKMINNGIHINIGQHASNITPDIDLVVYTAAVHKDNEEYMTAISMNKPMLSRAELLGQLMQNYDIPIAVAGTHGKTTTTSMMSHILLEGELDPTISVGGILKAIDGNIRVGGNKYFLTEACEYTNSFLHFFPKISIILNIDEDHLDFFKDLDDIYDSFYKFAELTSDDGALIMNGNIDRISNFKNIVGDRLITYGTDPSFDYYAKNIKYNSFGCASFDIYMKENMLGSIELSVTGAHNVLNALAASAAALKLNIPFDDIRTGLLSFNGTNRRFENKGVKNGIIIIDDYAHHPTEIRATLKAAANYPHREIWCIFQPHTYTRTKALFHEFADALALADHVILTDIYAARETDTLGVSSKMLADEIVAKGANAYYFSTFNEIEDFCIKNCKKNDLLITMGAGNVVSIGESILKR